MHILEKGRSLVPVLTNRVLSSSSTFSKDNTITDLYATDEFRATHAVIVLNAQVFCLSDWGKAVSLWINRSRSDVHLVWFL